MSRHEEFEMLAVKLLLALTTEGGVGFPSPEKAPFLVDTALALAEDFLTKLKLRRESLDTYDGLLLTEVQLVRSGNLIAAIKSIRERTSMSLKAAKAVVDRARAEFLA